ERNFIEHAFKRDGDGRLIYPEQVYAAPKKSGKTGFAAMHMLTTTLIFGGSFAEGYCVANDEEQAQGRVFQAIRRIVEKSPLLRREGKLMQYRIEFPATGAAIAAIASDYAGAAGANPTISCFDELWGYTSERSRRLWDEMVPSPARKISCRFTSTYAGFEGESALLEELRNRGHALPRIGNGMVRRLRRCRRASIGERPPVAGLCQHRCQHQTRLDRHRCRRMGQEGGQGAANLASDFSTITRPAAKLRGDD